MTSKKLYLHIGTAKTGTSTIQHFLGTELVTSFGYRQLEAFGLGNAWRLSVAAGTKWSFDYWVHQQRRRDITEPTYKDIVSSLWENAQSEVSACSSERFVASSEFILGLFGTEPATIPVLRDRLFQVFDDVRLIVYLRDQRSFLKSMYGQFVKGSFRETMPFEKFIEQLPSRRDLWDYKFVLEPWIGAFGKNRLRVALFDKNSFKGGNLLSDFLFRIDCVTIDTASASMPKDKNVSPTFFQLELLRYINMLRAPAIRPLDRRLRRACVSSMTRRFGPISFPSHHDETILETVSASNAWVNSTFGLEKQYGLPVKSRSSESLDAVLFS